jgi:PTS system galactitol-specific IIC component
MDAFLSGLKAIIDTLGATVLLPVVIFIIALILGAKAASPSSASISCWG